MLSAVSSHDLVRSFGGVAKCKRAASGLAKKSYHLRSFPFRILAKHPHYPPSHLVLIKPAVVRYVSRFYSTTSLWIFIGVNSRPNAWDSASDGKSVVRYRRLHDVLISSIIDPGRVPKAFGGVSPYSLSPARPGATRSRCISSWHATPSAWRWEGWSDEEKENSQWTTNVHLWGETRAQSWNWNSGGGGGGHRTKNLTFPHDMS